MKAITPVSAVSAVSIAPAFDGGAASLRPGDLLCLRLLQQDGLEWMAQGANGLRLRLPAAIGLHGDTVLMRVFQVQPRLELQPVDRQLATASPMPRALPTEGLAMRTDQAWLHLLRPQARPGPGGQAESLATQWRTQVLAEALRTVPEDGQSSRVAAAVFTLQGWQGQSLLLRLIDADSGAWPALGDESDEEKRRPVAEEAPAALSICLSVCLGGEWIHILLRWRQGLLMQISIADSATLQTMRGLMPRIASSLAAVPLRLLHCHLGAKPLVMAAASVEQQFSGLAAASSRGLFRAAAEIVAVLQST